MIELKNVSKFYNDNNIVTVGLRNISLKLNKGEFVAITGDSGSGKSTLLNVISSIDTYDEGEILYYGNETFYFNQNDSDTFRKNNVSFIFQKYNIVDSYTVLQNVMLPLLIQGKTLEEAKEKAYEIIKKVGLEHRVSNKGSKLSGGEKQRCVIARALATDAPILACDEPTGNLDKKTSDEIIKLIKEVSRDKLVLIVTHDYESVKDICTRKIKLSDGEIIEDISFKEGLEEEKKEMVLVNTKPSFNTLFKIAFLNIFSTPKKTVFSSLVFTFVSCLLLLLTLVMVQVSYEENYTYSDTYGIISEEKMIIYEDNHESLDMDKLNAVISKYEHYENAFFEEIRSFIYIGNNMNADVKITFTDVEYELVAGVNEIKEKEFIIVMPDYYYSNYYANSIGMDLSLVTRGDMEYKLPIGKLVGIGISEEVNDMYLLCNESDMYIANIIINNEVSLYYSQGEINKNKIKVVYVANEEKPYYIIPNSLKDEFEFNFILNDLYDVTYDLDIIYSDDATEPVFVMNKDFLSGKIAPNFGGVKELTVYADNVIRLSKEISKLGYDVTIPSMVDNQDGLSLIVLYLLIVVIIVVLAIMFFISFAIIQRIYLTKTKDYSIFRTLGLVSKDLKKVLNIEVIAISLISLILGALLSNLIIIISKIDLYKYVSGLLLLLYAITMLIFGLLTSNRLNSKIFKNSVYQGLREEGE